MKRQLAKYVVNKLLSQSDRREYFRNLLSSDLMIDTINQICQKNNLKFETVFDVGASDGGWSIALNKHFKKSQFILFEANTNYRKALDRSKFQYFSYVLAQKTEERLFWQANDHGDSLYQDNSTKYQKIEPIRIQAHALDDVISENGLPIPNLLKIDTQGSEVEILQGAKEALKKIDFIYLECPIYVTNKGAPNISEYLQVASSYNFIPIQIGEIHRTKNNYLVQIDILFAKSHLIGPVPY